MMTPVVKCRLPRFISAQIIVETARRPTETYNGGRSGAACREKIRWEASIAL